MTNWDLDAEKRIFFLPSNNQNFSAKIQYHVDDRFYTLTILSLQKGFLQDRPSSFEFLDNYNFSDVQNYRNLTITVS